MKTDAEMALHALARYREYWLSLANLSCLTSPTPEYVASQLRQCDRLLGLGDAVMRDPVFRSWAADGHLTEYVEDSEHCPVLTAFSRKNKRFK